MSAETRRLPSGGNGITRRQSLLLTGAATISLALGGVAPADARPSERATLFGRKEIKRFGPGKFPKWRGALERYFDEAKLVDAPCRPGRFTRCQLIEWQAFLESLDGVSPDKQVDVVNREMNQHAYILDIINWKIEDYWTSPGQFLRKDGDCEDYAITKYMSLRALGTDPDAMRIVVLHDLNLKVGHAVLALDRDNDTLILDNQISTVISHRRIHHYQPIYAVNEHSWWLYLRA